ncbi:hypothetical protein SNEBB_003955 [Seison nebaliae]|nr:hypothetical protein SNEBB_003955 [Seison nebaliae]
MKCFSFDKTQCYKTYALYALRFPYKEYQAKLGVGIGKNVKMESGIFPKLPKNTIGCSFLIAILATLQSAPYFMLEVHKNYMNDNWHDIMNNVYSTYSNIVTDRYDLPGRYLAMQLFAAYNHSHRLHRSNYLEYFVYLTIENSTTSGRSKLIRNTLKRLSIDGGGKAVKVPLKPSQYMAAIKYNYKDYLMLINNLFSDTPVNDFKESEIGNLFDIKYGESLPRNDLDINIFTFPELGMWLIDMMVEDQDIPLCSPKNKIIHPNDLDEYLDNESNQFLSDSLKIGQPKFIILTFTLFNSNKFFRGYRRCIHISYYTEIFRIINGKGSLETKEKTLKETLIPTTLVKPSYDYSRPLTDLSIFEKISGGDNKEKYDITSFVFIVTEPMTNAYMDELPKVIKKNLTVFHEMSRRICVEHYHDLIKEHANTLLSGPQAWKDWRAMEPLITDNVDSICRSYMKTDRFRMEDCRTESYGIALVRSLDKKYWFHIVNDIVSVVDNIQTILKAYRYEQITFITLSSTQFHENKVKELENIIFQSSKKRS